MPHVERHSYTRPVPADAKPVTRNGRPAVTWTGRNGKPVFGLLCESDPGRCIVATSKYYAVFRDERGYTRRKPGARDRSTTEAYAARLQAEADARRLGVKVVLSDHAIMPLAAHVEDYRLHLAAKNDTAKYVAKTVQKITAIINGIGAVMPGELDATAVERWLADRRAAGWIEFRTMRRPFHAATSNHYLRAIKGFCRWMVDFHRLDRDPLSMLSLLNADVDLQRERRTLDHAEFERLITVTAASDKPFRYLSGKDRAMLYIVAAWTGLRAAELASLTPGSFDLQAANVTVAATSAKSRRRGHVPLAAGLLTRLATWLKGRPVDARCWPGSWAGDAAEMLRADLTAAKIAYKTDGLHFDFHSLRHQFTAMLEAAGIDLKERQRLLRHSTPVLTANVYHRLRRSSDVKSAADRLPSPPKF